jgi:hypothetical protein
MTQQIPQQLNPSQDNDTPQPTSETRRTLILAYEHAQYLDELLDFAESVDIAEMLTDLLERHHKTRQALMLYLIRKGFPLTRSALDRYFNGHRTPDLAFCEAFAQYLCLNAQEQIGLYFALVVARRRRRIVRLYEELQAVS